MIRLPRGSSGEQKALTEMNEILGYDLAQVISSDQWFVALVDGEPQVMMNASGFRAVALFAPDPESGRRLLDWVDTLPGASDV